MSREDRAYSYVGTPPAESLQVLDPILDADAASKKFVLSNVDSPHSVSTSLILDDSWKNITNRTAGSTTITLTLPDAIAAIGRNFFFTKIDSGTLQIKAAGSDVIQDSIVGGIIQNNITTELFAHLVLKSVQTGAGPITARWVISTGTLTWSTENSDFFFGLGAGGSGVNFKKPVRLASTSNVPVSAGTTLDTLDGITLNLNDRILLPVQTTGSENGIYTVTIVGAGTNGTWTRAKDFDENAEVVAGSIIIVEEGTVNDNKAFILSTNNPIVLGTTSLTFSLFPSTPDIANPLQTDLIPINSTLSVGDNRQLIVAQQIFIDGTLDLSPAGSNVGGTLYILP